MAWYDARNIVLGGGGPVIYGGRLLGGVEGDVLLVPTTTFKEIDFVTQAPGTILDTRKLGTRYQIRMVLVEVTLENLQLALGGVIRVNPNGQRILEVSGEGGIIPKAPLEIYCLAPHNRMRKVYAFSAGVREVAEIPLQTPDHQKISLTFELYPYIGDLSTTPKILYIIEPVMEVPVSIY